MKLFLNQNCPHCEEVNKEDINVETIYTDVEEYQGVIPPQVPLLQFSNGMQLNGSYAINTIFDELRGQK